MCRCFDERLQRMEQGAFREAVPHHVTRQDEQIGAQFGQTADPSNFSVLPRCQVEITQLEHPQRGRTRRQYRQRVSTNGEESWFDEGGPRDDSGCGGPQGSSETAHSQSTNTRT